MSIAESRPVDGDVLMVDAQDAANENEDVPRRDQPPVTGDGGHVNTTSESGNTHTLKSPSQEQSQPLSLISPPPENGHAQGDARKDGISGTSNHASKDRGKNEEPSVIENGGNGQSERPGENGEREKHQSNGYVGVNGNAIDMSNSKPIGPPRETAPNDHPPTITPGYEPSRTSPPSPIGTASESTNNDKERARLEEVLSQTSPSIAQRVFRDQWRVLLFAGYDEHHISFLLRCLLKNSNHSVLDRIRRDDSLFKGPLLETAVTKQPVISRVLSNATPYQLHEYVPQHILDTAFERRLQSIDGRTLLNWLAAHGRLGYEQRDIIDRNDETVIPVLSPTVPAQADIHMNMRNSPRLAPSSTTMGHFGGASFPSQPVANQYIHQPMPPQQPQPQPQLQPPPQPRPQLQPQLLPQLQPQRRQPPKAMICPYCHRHFNNRSGYNYHVHKKVCEKEAPEGSWKWMCTLCAQGFTTKQGRDYHELKGVCRDCDIAPATAPTTGPAMSGPPMPSQPSFSSTPIPRPPLITPAPVPQVGQGQQAQQPPHTQATSQSQFSSPEKRASLPHPPGSAQPVQQPRAPGAPSIPRPPLYTPSNRPKKEIPKDIRQSPSQLPPDVLASLNRDIQEEDRRYRDAVSETERMNDPKAREAKLTSLKNGNASRKSQIRKRYGVSLRLREKDKHAMRPSVNKNRIEGFRASEAPRSSNPQVVIPAMGFSPINASQRPSPSTTNMPQRSSLVNGYGSPYGPPPPPSSSRAQVSTYHPTPSSQPEGSPYQHDRTATPLTTTSGAQTRYIPQDQTPAATYGKRRREDDDGGHDPRPPSQPATFDAILYQGPPPKRPITSTSPKPSLAPLQPITTTNAQAFTPTLPRIDAIQANHSTSAPPRTNASDTPAQNIESNGTNPARPSVSNSTPVSDEPNRAANSNDEKAPGGAKKDTKGTGSRTEDSITVISSDSD